MAYYLALFSPETYEAFKRSDRTVSGFRIRQKNAAERIKESDKLLCYLTKLGRWFGVLEVRSKPFINDQPIFYPEDDPFTLRFLVAPLIVLDVDKAIPIREDILWQKLSFTKGHDKALPTWTGRIRSSLTPIDEADGQLIEELLRKQQDGDRNYGFDVDEYAELTSRTIRRADKTVSVFVPSDSEEHGDHPVEPEAEVRESIRVQALIADIGSRMGLKIWIAKADRGGVLQEAQGIKDSLVDRLPLNYDDVTLRTIEQIDVLWLRGRSIVRAFEVEHTTSVYSGILRMADLLALQPNMDINLHIVAPSAKREKVFQEIRRPVFSLLEGRPLAERCTYLSYESLRELAKHEHLKFLSDRVLDEYAEEEE